MSFYFHVSCILYDPMKLFPLSCGLQLKYNISNMKLCIEYF
jgi:hypothetical protein